MTPTFFIYYIKTYTFNNIKYQRRRETVIDTLVLVAM